MVALAAYIAGKRTTVDAALQAALPARHPDPGRLVEAMRYTLLLPGKRLRATTCLATAEAFGGRERDALAFGVAVEMVHAASLVLDDLPAFDDARMRRGQPTNHLVFGESTAMLASIGLLNAAYRHLALTLPTKWLGPDLAAAATIALAEAVGENGMVAGEALDLAARGTTPGLDALERIHALKTGSLFIAAIVEAGRLAGAGSVEQAALRAYAKNLGLAFQIVDDLLEVTSTPAQTGKDVTTADGPTFVSLAGTDGARQIVHELIETAVQSLAPLGRRGARLCELARQSEQRDR